MLEELKQAKDRAALIKERCGQEMDYGSGSDAVQNGYILAGELIALLDTLIAGQGWMPIDDEARAGHAVDVYFMKNGKYVHSRTSYLIEEQRGVG